MNISLERLRPSGHCGVRTCLERGPQRKSNPELKGLPGASGSPANPTLNFLTHGPPDPLFSFTQFGILSLATSGPIITSLDAICTEWVLSGGEMGQQRS